MSRAERITQVADHGTSAGRQRLDAQIRPVTLAGTRCLPVCSGLEGLFPQGGLQRGTTVVVSADPGVQGATTLGLALGAAASSAGAWCAAVAFPDLGIAAVAELGITLRRLALVPDVGPREWVTVVGALLDAVDVVMVRPPAHLRAGDARRLTTRARERGGVLVPILGHPYRSPAVGAWSGGADLRLCVSDARWEGPGVGEGRLLSRRITVTTAGRGAAARERQVQLWLPAPEGGIRATQVTVQRPAFAGSDADLLPDVAHTSPHVLRSAG
ncbi:MAG: hypothetical protein NVS3B12_30730 [Acidimicrobiales bacterium]